MEQSQPYSFMMETYKLTESVDKIVDYFCNKDNYYYSQAGGAEDILADTSIPYQTNQKKAHMTVDGNLADTLGFKQGQNISSMEFAQLMNCCGPDGKRLCREHDIVGLTLTFSPPKSVSVAGLITDRDPAILAIHEEVVREVMHEYEEHIAYAQPKPGENVYTGKLAYASVTDGFSREHDPHIHTHVIIPNLTELNGRFMAFRQHKALEQETNKLYGALYRERMAVRYQKKGREMSYMKDGEFRDLSVSRELDSEFSTRRKQIVKEKGKGLSDMAAWEKTRAKKKPGIDKEQVKEDWQDRTSKYAVKSLEQNRQADLEARSKWADEAEFIIEATQERARERDKGGEIQRWQLAVQRVTDKTATASREAVITEYLNEHIRARCENRVKGEALTLNEAERRLAMQVAVGNLAEIDGRITSWELISAEREYMDSADKWTNHTAATKAEADIFLKGYQATAKKPLSKVQETAVKEIITRNKLVTTLQGSAGAGKTTALRAAADYFRGQGKEVVGLAMQGAAAKNLETETGIKSRTLSSFLRDKKPGTDRIIIFDEASMIDSRNAAKLVKQAEQQGDRVILVGDRDQIQSINAGCVFENLVTHSEVAGDLIVLNENYRQRNPELVKAVKLARDGNMKDSLTVLDKYGSLLEIKDTTARREAVSNFYNKDTLIIAGTVAARDDLNNKIRKQRETAGELKPGKIYNMVRADKDGIAQDRQLELSEGEVITFTKNNYKKYDIRNGQRATVIECKEKSIIVETEKKRRIEINTERYPNIDYGYAMTTFKAQGQTYDKVVIEADTHTPQQVNMRNQYVNMTRSRDDVKIFTDNKEFLIKLAEVKTNNLDTTKSEYTYTAKARQAELEQRLAHGDTELAQAKPTEKKVEPAREMPSEFKLTPAQSSPAEQEQTAPELLEIKNKFVMEKVEGLDDEAKKYTDKMKALTDELNKSKEFTPEAKAQIVDALNSEQGSKAILKYHDRPEAYTLYAGACIAEGAEAVLRKYDLPEDFKRMQDLDKSQDRGFDMEM